MKQIHTTPDTLAATNKDKCKRWHEKIKLEKIIRGDITVKKPKKEPQKKAESWQTQVASDQ